MSTLSFEIRSKYKIVKLKHFKGGLHLARGLSNSYDKSLETLHSDTLKSAIFACAINLFGKEKVGETFFNQFLISSAFPFFHDQTAQSECLYFFPKPELVKLPLTLEEGFSSPEKSLKKVRYLEKRLFEELLRGEIQGTYKSEQFVGGFASHANTSLRAILAKAGCTEIIKSEPYQHVHIPRDQSADSEPYFVDKIYFHQHAGLFFLVFLEDETVDPMLNAALRLLAENGIGTNRNIGNGHFDLEMDELELDTPTSAAHQVNLSLYWPIETEIKDCIQDSYYNLTKRGGYISSPEKDIHLTIRKRSVYMFTEGSIFPHRPDRKGQLGNLAPKFDTLKHPIWRDGQPIFLPINLESHDS